VSYKDWHEILPFALHGYQTSVHTSTGATPFSLVYGMEVVLPFEVEVSSLRILAESGLKESEWAQACFNQLNLIEGKRLAAMSHGHLYQKRVKNAFDKKVRPCRFSEGNLLLKKVSQALKDNRGKWAPNYEGAFIVKRAFSGGAIALTNTACFIFWGFPQGFLSSVFFSSQSFKERGIGVSLFRSSLCALKDV